MGDTTSMMNDTEKAGYHHFSINLHRWNLLPDLRARRSGFRRREAVSSGKV